MTHLEDAGCFHCTISVLRTYYMSTHYSTSGLTHIYTGIRIFAYTVYTYTLYCIRNIHVLPTHHYCACILHYKYASSVYVHTYNNISMHIQQYTYIQPHSECTAMCSHISYLIKIHNTAFQDQHLHSRTTRN